MPALVLTQTIRLRGLRPSLIAAAFTVGEPRQSMKVAASVISPEAIANSRWLPPLTWP